MSASVQITVTVPDSLINDARVRDEIEKALRTRTAPELRRQFNKTVEGWGHKPDFSQKFTSRTDYISATVYASGPNADQYEIVNYGSRQRILSHPGVAACCAFNLAILRCYPPESDSQSRETTLWLPHWARKVKHPGFEAREFDVAIAEEIAPDFEKDVQEAIGRAAASRP